MLKLAVFKNENGKFRARSLLYEKELEKAKRDPDVKVCEIVAIEGLKHGIRVWSEDGKAWYMGFDEEGHIWFRDPKHDEKGEKKNG